MFTNIACTLAATLCNEGLTTFPPAIFRLAARASLCFFLWSWLCRARLETGVLEVVSAG